MVNQKRGLTDSVSYPTMEIPGRPTTYWKSGAKENHQLNPGIDTVLKIDSNFFHFRLLYTFLFFVCSFQSLKIIWDIKFLQFIFSHNCERFFLYVILFRKHSSDAAHKSVYDKASQPLYLYLARLWHCIHVLRHMHMYNNLYPAL